MHTTCGLITKAFLFPFRVCSIGAQIRHNGENSVPEWSPITARWLTSVVSRAPLNDDSASWLADLKCRTSTQRYVRDAMCCVFVRRCSA